MLRADETRQGFRRPVVRFLRWVIGDTKAWALAKRLANRAELRILARQLSVSSTREHRQVACRLAVALRRNDEQTALAIGTHARQKPDLKAEKIISHRYRFIWMCNPKVASRSMIQALLAADSEAVLLREKTMDETLSVYPEARRYFSFAFVRDPCDRTRSFFADKLVVHPTNEWSVGDRFYGLRKGMEFADYCRWLATPFGSDAFAERHWLSQTKQLRINGNLPDYIGSYENLEANWQCVLARLGVPYSRLHNLNQRRVGIVRVDDDSIAILRRRYSDDFDLIVTVGSGGLTHDEHSLGRRR